MKTRKELIADTISDAVTNLLFYHRKEDESLTLGAIEDAIYEGEITVEWMAAEFARHLEHLNE